MNLVMFDIDGTLTQTTSIDERCFVRAIHDVLKIHDIDTNVLNYSHVTDQGIASEIIERYTDCAATEETLSEITDQFVCLIREEASNDSALICPVPGAVDMLNRLHQAPDQAVSLVST